MKTLSELRKEPHWSASSLNGLLHICGLQWAFRKVYEIEPESTGVNLIFGKAFHVACEFILSSLQHGTIAATSDIEAVLVDVFDVEVKAADAPVAYGDTHRDELLRLGGRMLLAYANGIDRDEEIIGMAVPFKTQLKDRDGIPIGKPLIGEIDLLVKKDGVTTVVDWKTSASRWPQKKADSSLQATAYLFAVKEQTGHIPMFRFDVVTKAKTPAYVKYDTSREAEDFYRLAELVRTAEQMVKHEVFIPNEQSFACKGCAFKSACRTWHQKRNTLMLGGLAA